MSKRKNIIINDCWNRIGVWRSSSERCEKLDSAIHCYNCDVYANTGRSLLNRDVPDGYKKEWTGILARKIDNVPVDMNSVLAFRLGSEWFGLPVSLISEITLMRGIFDLPHNNNRIIRGLVNIRGILTICISLGSLLGLDKPDEDWEEDEHSIQRLIILHMDSGDIVFPVSEIDSIFRYHNDDIEPSPLSSRKDKDGFLQGMLPWKEKHLGCMAAEKITSALKRIFQ